MVYHRYCPASFICSIIIPIPKGSNVNLSVPDKYKSISISSILGKILDNIIIVKQSDALRTSQYQYGFIANSSTVLCSTMVIETVQYYTVNGARPAYDYFLMLPKDSRKLLSMFYSMNCEIEQCARVQSSCYILCILINHVV